MSSTPLHPFGSSLGSSTGGDPVLVAGDLRKPLRTEEEARKERAAKERYAAAMRAYMVECRQEREEADDDKAEEAYRREARQIWSER